MPFASWVTGCLLLASFSLQGQDARPASGNGGDLDQYIDYVLDHHPVLQAQGREVDRTEAEFRSATRWDPLTAKGYYLPFSDVGDRYHEWEVSQAGLMPGAIRARSRYGAAVLSGVEADVRVFRQEFGGQTWNQAIDAWYWQSHAALLRQRLEGTEKWAEWYKLRAEAGLETQAVAQAAALQRAQHEAQLARAEGTWEMLMAELRARAGGPFLEWERVELPARCWQNGPRPLGDSTATWARLDARWAAAERAVEVAERERQWEQVGARPQWEVGWNQQGVPGAMYRGAMAGVVVPLAGRNAGVAQAHIAHLQAQEREKGVQQELQAAVAREWEAYGKWMEVRAGLAYQLENDATEEQMVQSLQAGGVAFPVFWAALESRRQLEDTLLELDAELLKLQGRILNHRFQ